MPPTPPDAQAFEAERAHLTAVAYRMLGSHAEAEDAVQEAWLRYAGTGTRDEIRDLRGWLTTTVGRICLDVLRSARVRREAYPGPWLPEPVVTAAESPESVAARRDEVALALLVVLDRLTPEQRRVLDAFVRAAGTGDIDGLLAVLAPDVVFIGDGGGFAPAARKPVAGAVQVARFAAGLFRRAERDQAGLRVSPVVVNGGAGLLTEAHYPDGTVLRMVLGVAVADGRITAVYNQLNPHKVARALDDR